MTNQTMNITTNLRAIETIKGEILGEIAKLYGQLADFEDTDVYDKVSSSIATIVAMDYILARRIGISYTDIDEKISELTGIAIDNNHELEMVFGDMSELRSYVGGKAHR